MGARFERWLARPSTLRFLRELIRPEEGRTWVGCHTRHSRTETRRCSATAAAVRDRDVEVEPARRTPTIRRLDHTAEEALALSAREMDMHMSVRSGVPFFGSPGDNGAPPAGYAKTDGGKDVQLGDTTTFEALRYQSDVAHAEKRGGLLVDQEENAQNISLWVEILQFRQRLDGVAGVVDVWRGMRMRDFDLPTEGNETDSVWPIFIRTLTTGKISDRGPPIPDLYPYVLDLKARTGQHYEQSYEILVGSLFSTHPASARYWHKTLTTDGLAPTGALRRVARDAIWSPQLHATKVYRDMYVKQSGERDLYDTCISAALEWEKLAASGGVMAMRKQSRRALDWHRFLLKHGDGPSQEMFAKPEVQRLFEMDKDRSLPMKHAKRTEQPTAPAVTKAREHPAMTRASMSSLVGDVHGIKPKEISDTFVAKMFATRAFPLDLILNGMSFFAVEKLGPVALRELAVRAGSHVEFCNKLVELKAMHVTITNTAYSRLLQKLAAESQSELYAALLASDQHPEAYSDNTTQEALLVEFLEAGNWTQAHLTLLSLSLTSTTHHASAYNLLIQHYLCNGQHTLTAQTIQQLQHQKLPLTRTTMTYLHRYLLPIRRRRMRPVESQRRDRPPFNALDFVTNALMYTDDIARAARGGEWSRENVPPRVWRELLKRYGMVHRWLEFERLVLWLADRYGGSDFRRQVRRRSGGVGGLRPHGPLPMIFDGQMVQAVFTWSFRSAAMRNGLQPLTSQDGEATGKAWYQGLPLLFHLRSVGVNVQVDDVRRAFWLRMWSLFGPGASQLPLNEIARRKNQLGLAHYISVANEMWARGTGPPRTGAGGELLFDIDRSLLQGDDDTVRQAQLLLAFFGPYGHVGWKKEERIHEYVDVQAWATDVAFAGDGGTSRQRPIMQSVRVKKSVKHRMRAWERSPLRVRGVWRPVKGGGKKVAGRRAAKPRLTEETGQEGKIEMSKNISS